MSPSFQGVQESKPTAYSRKQKSPFYTCAAALSSASLRYLVDLWGWVAQIAHRIKMKISEKQIAKAMAERLASEARRPFSKLN